MFVYLCLFFMFILYIYVYFMVPSYVGKCFYLYLAVSHFAPKFCSVSSETCVCARECLSAHVHALCTRMFVVKESLKNMHKTDNVMVILIQTFGHEKQFISKLCTVSLLLSRILSCYTFSSILHIFTKDITKFSS